MKAIKFLYLPILLLLAGNVQGQNEDPTCPVPDDCILFVETYWENMNDPKNPDHTKELRRLTVAPLAELDSIFIRIGTERDKGEALDIKGKLNIQGRYIDFGSFGKIFIDKSTGYLAYIEFDLMQRIDKKNFVYFTIRAKDITGLKRDLRVRNISETLGSYSNDKRQLKFFHAIDYKSKMMNIRYFVATPINATIAMLNSNGSVAKILETNIVQSGQIDKVYDLTGLVAGMYILKLQLGQSTLIERIFIQ